MKEQQWLRDKLGQSTIGELASKLTGSELQSVLLEVMRRRAASRAPKDVVAQYERDALCAPSPVDLRTSLLIDRELLAAATEFEAVELAPVAPLGTCSTVAITHQNRVLSALRSTEVVSDPTNVLALECARRSRTRPRVPIHLATSQRVVRTQPAPKLPGYTQHFRMFALSSGGPETRNRSFTCDTLAMHIRTLMRGLDHLEHHGYGFGDRRVKLLATNEQQSAAGHVLERLRVQTELDSLDHPYYSGGLRFQVWVTPTDGPEVPLIDGGTFDWLAQLGSNRRAVFVGSAIGTQLIAQQFRKSTT